MLNLSLDSVTREKARDVLQALLADEFSLYTQTLDAHWNLQGSNFIALHKLLENQYESFKISADEIAERIRALGFETKVGFDLYKKSLVNDSLKGKHQSDQVIMILLENYSKLISHMRESIQALSQTQDFVTVDMLTKCLSQHEKNAWMLNSHVAKE